MYQPLDRSDAPTRQVCHQRLHQQLGDSRPLEVEADSGDHQVAMLNPDSTVVTDECGVSRDPHDLAVVVLGDEDLPSFIDRVGIVAPADDTTDDLGNLGQPRRADIAKVERRESGAICLDRVPEDHRGWIGCVAPFAFQRVEGTAGGALR